MEQQAQHMMQPQHAAPRTPRRRLAWQAKLLITLGVLAVVFLTGYILCTIY